ncbi:D-ribulose-phosphate-3 epimerase [Actinobacillus equuli]|nr:D-ribulose-phosphate-3 epimerase [Actinobacillus equuli]
MLKVRLRSPFLFTFYGRLCLKSIDYYYKDKHGSTTVLIAPSILSADLARLGDDVTEVLKAGGDIIHFDVMDNHFVPNLTFGPAICKALRDYGITAEIDVHLMVKPVERLIPDLPKRAQTILPSIRNRPIISIARCK